MRAEIKRLHLQQHATTVYVTHDQVEAMAMGDRIVVMSAAVVQQIGTPYDVYADPANLFVARFIGSPGMNLLPAQLAGAQLVVPGAGQMLLPAVWGAALANADLPGGAVIVGFRPEAVRVADDGALRGRVYADDLHGPYSMLHLQLDDGQTIVHARAARDLRATIDSQMRFDLDPAQLRFFHPTTERRISNGS